MVLVEISFASQPMDLKEMLFELQMKGYQPILAHPERYTFYHHPPSVYRTQSNGLLFQSNLLSFSGYYGGSVQDAAEYLVNEGMTDLLGTDLHHDRHLDNSATPLYPGIAKCRKPWVDERKPVIVDS